MVINPQHAQEFVSLLTDHQGVIRAYIISMAPNSHDIRDILQDVNLLLWERMNDFQLGTNFGAWACTIAHYVVLDYRKKMKRDGILIFSDELSQIVTVESKTTTPEIVEKKRRALQQCLKKLSAKDRKLLSTRYSHASPKEAMRQTSLETGRSRASLRVSLSRLRAGLKLCIKDTISMEGGLS